MRNVSCAVLSIALFWLAGSQVARAQQTPDNGQPLPSYARPNNLQTIQGRITAVNGLYNINVLDANGYIDNVALRQGTIINPTGLTLAVGMNVSIIGVNGGSAFDASEIDLQTNDGGAPQYSAPAPGPYPAPYYGAGWAYPGYPYGYAYGPGWGFYIGGAVVVGGPYGYGRYPYYYGRRYYYGRPYYPYYGRPPYYGRSYGPYPSYGRPSSGSTSGHAPVVHSSNTHSR